MSTVQRIKQPIEAEMELFEKKFYDSMASQVPLLNRITYYIVTRKGKQMRPMFVFLCAKLAGEGTVQERTYRGASVIELIHTASLVHDDVVDDSDKRRGFFSINAVWKNKIAVLVGDYMLSKGMLLCIEHKDFDLLELISVAVREMSQGELLQIEKAKKLDITEAVYLEIIRQKTASLITACCALGAASVGASPQEVQRFSDFGAACGMAFQIKDDLFDYGKSQIGKPTGIDIKEQKMTLPLIYAIEHATLSERKWMLGVVKKHNTDRKKVRELIAWVKEKGGMEYAVQRMNEYRDQALSLISDFPDSPAKKSLYEMVNYVVDRPL